MRAVRQHTTTEGQSSHPSLCITQNQSHNVFPEKRSLCSELVVPLLQLVHVLLFHCQDSQQIFNTSKMLVTR